LPLDISAKTDNIDTNERREMSQQSHGKGQKAAALLARIGELMFTAGS
jgi:hypothetical protein